MRGDPAVDNLGSCRFERFERAGFIRTHDPAVTNHVSGTIALKRRSSQQIIQRRKDM